jgi:hypothetical protein
VRGAAPSASPGPCRGARAARVRTSRALASFRFVRDLQGLRRHSHLPLVKTFHNTWRMAWRLWPLLSACSEHLDPSRLSSLLCAESVSEAD